MSVLAVEWTVISVILPADFVAKTALITFAKAN